MLILGIPLDSLYIICQSAISKARKTPKIMLPTQQKTSPGGRGEVKRNSQLLQRFIKHLRSHDRSERTVKSYSSDLKLFAQWFYEANREELTPQSITPIDLREYKRYLLDERGFKPATVNRRLASISAFCKWAQEQGLADGNPCDEIAIIPDVRTAPSRSQTPCQHRLYTNQQPPLCPQEPTKPTSAPDLTV